jgi:hypothetical protein
MVQHLMMPALLSAALSGGMLHDFVVAMLFV